jgi:hypothetical protein
MDSNAAEYEYGEQIPLRWDRGPVSFGLMVAGSVVSWSAPGARDFLMSRCWRGVYLYPSAALADAELRRDPIKVVDNVVYLTRAFPCDLENDGREDLLLTDRPGFIHACRRTGDFPDLSFAAPEVLRDAGTDLPFKLLHQNPFSGKPNAPGGYVDPDFLCYVFPLVYPRDGAPACAYNTTEVLTDEHGGRCALDSRHGEHGMSSGACLCPPRRAMST